MFMYINLVVGEIKTSYEFTGSEEHNKPDADAGLEIK